uniref:Uncharacterized protein n=1 Tax=viral metagenome TaxID=1070528 RepID=A0A6M3MGC4_9ZZZZ
MSRIDSDIKAADNISDDFKAELEKVLRSVLIAAIALASTRGNVITTEDIERLLTEKGFYQVGEGLLTTGQTELMDNARKYIAAEVKKEVEYSDDTIAKLETVRKDNSDAYVLIGAVLAQKIVKELTSVEIGMAAPEAITESLEKAVTTAGNQGATWTQTTTFDTYRNALVMLGIQEGLNRYRYHGPLDEKTRPFCRLHVDEVKTWQEWSTIDNGMNGVVTVAMGGFRCRHALIPV